MSRLLLPFLLRDVRLEARVVCRKTLDATRIIENQAVLSIGPHLPGPGPAPSHRGGPVGVGPGHRHHRACRCRIHRAVGLQQSRALRPWDPREADQRVRNIGDDTGRSKPQRRAGVRERR